jgi:hypothetical protein
VAGGSAPLAKHTCGNCPGIRLCGHPNEEIRCERNQSLATRLEVGFLGSLGPMEVSTLRLLNFLETE